MSDGGSGDGWLGPPGRRSCHAWGRGRQSPRSEVPACIARRCIPAECRKVRLTVAPQRRHGRRRTTVPLRRRRIGPCNDLRRRQAGEHRRPRILPGGGVRMTRSRTPAGSSGSMGLAEGGGRHKTEGFRLAPFLRPPQGPAFSMSRRRTRTDPDQFDLLDIPEATAVMLTYSGRTVDLARPDFSRFDIEDVARPLAYQCRFVGNTRAFFSVAQHCVLASQLAPKGYEYEALMHDSEEAF